MTTATYSHQRMDTTTAALAAVAGDLLPWREAATLAEVKPGTLQKWIDRGKVPTVLLLGKRMVSIATVSEVELSTRHRRT